MRVRRSRRVRWCGIFPAAEMGMKSVVAAGGVKSGEWKAGSEKLDQLGHVWLLVDG